MAFITQGSVSDLSGIRKLCAVRAKKVHWGRVGAAFFLLPLWEKVAWTQSAPDEGSPSAETDPSPVSNELTLIRSTLSHKGRGKEKPETDG
jgi:hypothetical protein